jgi:hypothetical protein
MKLWTVKELRTCLLGTRLIARIIYRLARGHACCGMASNVCSDVSAM